jgi:nitrite reductase (NADH) small subunit
MHQRRPVAHRWGANFCQLNRFRVASLLLEWAQSKEGMMPGDWKLICKLKDVPLDGARLVPRGLAWQELPGVALFRSDLESVHAVLDCAGVEPRASNARRYSVKVENCRVYLDLNELSAPASKAEAALAGQFGVATSLVAYCY